jgi:hypothetical protein
MKDMGKVYESGRGSGKMRIPGVRIPMLARQIGNNPEDPMRRTALTSIFCLALGSALGARTALASPEGGDGPRSTLSIHPIGTVALNVVPDYHFFQFTYEYHPGPGRLSWAWDPALILHDGNEAGNPRGYDLWVLPVITPRWYFRPDAQGWFGGLKLGYIHYSFRNDEQPPAYATHRKYRDRSELGFAAGEAGFKRDWKPVSFYVSGQLGIAMGAIFSEYTEAELPTERSSHMTATPFGQINCGLGYRF